MGIVANMEGAVEETDQEAMNDDLKQAIADVTQVRAECRQAFMQRDAEIDGLLVSLIAGEHVLLLGPPGTAKSALVRAVCEAVESADFFYWLMTKFTVPEEVFGPISLKALEEDKVRRITSSKLPEANIAFLDEIFKSNSSILNSLLTIINERLYHNGNGKPTEVPLWMMAAASNELPDSDDLSALFDRFLLRYNTEYLFDRDDQKALLSRGGVRGKAQIHHAISQKQLEFLQEAVADVDISDNLIDLMLDMKVQLEQEGIKCSDRRWKQCVGLVAAKSLLEGRMTACEEDLLILEHAMWREPSQIPLVSHKVGSVAAPSLSEARASLDAAKEVFHNLLNLEGTDEFEFATIDTRKVLKKSRNSIEELLQTMAGEGRTSPRIEGFLKQIINMQEEVKRRADRSMD